MHKQFSILVTVFVQVVVVSLPLLKDAALHGENLENSYSMYNSCVRGMMLYS